MDTKPLHPADLTDTIVGCGIEVIAFGQAFSNRYRVRWLDVTTVVLSNTTKGLFYYKGTLIAELAPILLTSRVIVKSGVNALTMFWAMDQVSGYRMRVG